MHESTFNFFSKRFLVFNSLCNSLLKLRFEWLQIDFVMRLYNSVYRPVSRVRQALESGHMIRDPVSGIGLLMRPVHI